MNATTVAPLRRSPPTPFANRFRRTITLAFVLGLLQAAWSIPAAADLGPIGAGFPMELRFHLHAAIDLALDRLAREPACRELFDHLGAEGDQALAAARFHLDAAESHRMPCASRASAAYTTVGGRDIHLCPTAFRRLGRHEAAAVILHELLHHGGMGEGETHPEGLRSLEITRRVQASCAL